MYVHMNPLACPNQLLQLSVTTEGKESYGVFLCAAYVSNGYVISTAYDECWSLLLCVARRRVSGGGLYFTVSL